MVIGGNSKDVAVFDLDNTLVRTDAANTAAYRFALMRMGCDVGSYAGRITSSVVRMLFPDMTDSELADVIRLKEAAYGRFLSLTREGAALGTLRAICGKRRAFAKVVLLTDARERRALETLRHHGLDSCFDEIVCNGGMGDKCANYFSAHDADPRRCHVWDDDAANVASAFASGVPIHNIRKVA